MMEDNNITQPVTVHDGVCVSEELAENKLEGSSVYNNNPDRNVERSEIDRANTNSELPSIIVSSCVDGSDPVSESNEEFEQLLENVEVERSNFENLMNDEVCFSVQSSNVECGNGKAAEVAIMDCHQMQVNNVRENVSSSISTAVLQVDPPSAKLMEFEYVQSAYKNIGNHSDADHLNSSNLNDAYFELIKQETHLCGSERVSTELAEEVRCDDEILLQELDAALDQEISGPSSISDEVDANQLDHLPNGFVEAAILKLHPIHQKLQTEMISLQQKCKHQAEEISRLQVENQRLNNSLEDHSAAVSTSSDIYEVQMEALEKTIVQLQRREENLNEQLILQEEATKKNLAQLQYELGGKLEKTIKRFEAANKEKETMVIKFAQSEKEVLTWKKQKDDVDKKLKELTREKEILMNKVKVLNNERSRLVQSADMKISELTAAQRESEKLKEDLTSRDIKIKWAQNKLKTEMEAHKESQVKLERLQQKLQQTREEAEQIRRDCQAMIRTYQESEEIKSNSLDLQLKEKETELKHERQEKTDQEEVYQMMQRELDALKKKQKLLIEENNSLTIKVQTLERERLEYEHNLSRLKEMANAHKQEIVDLTAKLAEMESLRAMLNREKEKTVANLNEIERMRQSAMELQADMEACRAKEGELLEFTERLTAKNVTLQSEYASLEAKSSVFEMEQNRLTKLTEELNSLNSSLQLQFEDEKQLRLQETQLLARKLAEKTKAVENLNLKLDEEINDNRVMKRRHISSVKELTREVHQLKRRLESQDVNVGSHSEALSGSSRASSSGSLDTLTNNQTNHSVSGMNNPALTYNRSAHVSNGSVAMDTSSLGVITLEPDRQMLIERIVKLQRMLARRNEKVEFLAEHVAQLNMELRKKARVIQGYIMREETGVLATSKMDQNKIELARRGGTMASVYSSHPTEEAMTLELSLEINQKFQAVLEDTLLKNITLKENISTLGDEIARLTKERHLNQAYRKSEIQSQRLAAP